MKKLAIIVTMSIMLAACGSSTKGASTSTSQNATPSTFSADCPSTTAPVEKRTLFTKAPPMCIDTNKSYTATMVTDAGTIVISLNAKAAPLTVNNFVFLTRYHFYDGLTFHRVLKGFMMQGGDPAGDGSGGPGYTFKDELPASASQYKQGSLAMANSGRNTNGSQFFIVFSDQGGAQLTPNYSLFGQVTQGLDVMQKIEADGSDLDPTPPTVVHKIVKVTISES